MADAGTLATNDEADQVYRCGTLTYTKIGLAALFIWLLWGDFCYTLMETIVPSIIPLKLKDLECPNWVMGIIITAIPNFMNMTVTPYISVKSDRCRTRWGRRLPFIAASMPFLSISLLLLGWSNEIASWLRTTIPGLQGAAPATLAIAVIAFFMILFQFFNQFLNAGFWALFNDVVPPTHLARFAGAFRMVGSASSALYSFFLFKYAGSHSHEIFLGATLLYLVGFVVLLAMVREGQYPPLDQDQLQKLSRWQATKAFFRESFRERIYQLLFISGGILAFAGVAWSFQVFFLLEMKMTLDEIGKYNAILAVAAFIATYFAAVFVDRWHPMRVYTYVVIFSLTGPMMNWVWLFIDLPGRIFFWLSLAAQLLYAFMNALSAACLMPLQMRLFPHSRFGQFGAAQGLIRAFCTIVAGMAVGGFFDLVRYLCTSLGASGLAGGSGYCYRFYFVWSATASLLNFIAIAWAYRCWNRLGGDAHFHPPAPWNPQGVEPVAIVATTGYQSKWLNISLRLMDGVMFGSLALVVIMLLPLQKAAMTEAVHWFLLLVIPLSVVVALLWFFLARGIRRDIKLAGAGQMPFNGIPHHGMMMVFGIKFLLTIGLVVFQLYIAFGMHNSLYVLLFALSNIVTNFLLLFCIWFVLKMEKGFAVKIDEASIVRMHCESEI